jgi:hypothetical protein
MPLTSFGASPSFVSTDRICRFPLLTVFLYDQRLLTLETWCGNEYGHTSLMILPSIFQGQQKHAGSHTKCGTLTVNPTVSQHGAIPRSENQKGEERTPSRTPIGISRFASLRPSGCAWLSNIKLIPFRSDKWTRLTVGCCHPPRLNRVTLLLRTG